MSFASKSKIINKSTFIPSFTFQNNYLNLKIKSKDAFNDFLYYCQISKVKYSKKQS